VSGSSQEQRESCGCGERKKETKAHGRCNEVRGSSKARYYNNVTSADVLSTRSSSNRSNDELASKHSRVNR